MNLGAGRGQVAWGEEALASLPALPSCRLGPASAPGTRSPPSVLDSPGAVAVLLLSPASDLSCVCLGERLR